ncbi:MAG: cysteine--tRNA ligase, partial [Sciscionella sp.]
MTGQQTAATPGGVRIAGQRLALLDKARIYACGITPYDVTHLGHAATFVWVDVLGRVLRHLGVEPEICRNVTDVDDVLQAAAARAGTSQDWYAAVGQFHFDADMSELNVRMPRHEPRAHRYVDQVIRLAGNLLAADAAYLADGSVYFRGGTVAERAGIEESEALRLAAEYGGLVDDPAKDGPLDVAVWQS